MNIFFSSRRGCPRIFQTFLRNFWFLYPCQNILKRFWTPPPSHFSNFSSPLFFIDIIYGRPQRSWNNSLELNFLSKPLIKIKALIRIRFSIKSQSVLIASIKFQIKSFQPTKNKKFIFYPHWSNFFNQNQTISQKRHFFNLFPKLGHALLFSIVGKSIFIIIYCETIMKNPKNFQGKRCGT